MISTVADLTKWARLVGAGALITPELQTERLRWDRLGDNDDNWHLLRPSYFLLLTFLANVLLRDISKILFPNNPVNAPVIK